VNRLKPATLDREPEPGAVLGGCGMVLEQEGPVDLLDIDAAVLDRLEGTGALQEPAGGLLGIGVLAWFGVPVHAAAWSSSGKLAAGIADGGGEVNKDAQR
jgi:hypothetical protein